MLNLNKDILEGKWLQIRGEIRNQWGKLTNDDLERIGGKRDKLEGVLRERYGYSKIKAKREVDKFLDNVSNVREKIQERAHDTQDSVQSQMQSTQESVQDQISTVRKSAAKKADKTVEQYNETMADVGEAVSSYPWLVVAGAFLAGFIIGLMLSQNKTNTNNW